MPLSSRRFKKPMVFGALALLLGLLIWWISKPSAENNKTPPPVPVNVAAVELRDVPYYLTGIGTVQSPHRVVVQSRVEGELVAVHFEEGQEVKEGQLLAEIDARPLQATLAQVKAEKAQAQAQLATAEADLKRYRNLQKENAIATQAVDQQEARVRELQASVQAAQATIEATQVQLGYTRITSPVTGRIGIRQVDPGNIVRASDAEGIVTVTQMRPIDVVFSLPQGSLAALQEAMRQGMPPVDALDKEGGRILASGTLATMDNEVDNTTGTVRLKARFANEDNALWPGQLVVARLQNELHRDALVIPAVALQRSSTGTFVYRLQENKAEVANVEVAFEDGTIAVIDQGLNAGEQIVIDGQARLKPGATVTVSQKETAGHEPQR